jgi:hypothetical protein
VSVRVGVRVGMRDKTRQGKARQGKTRQTIIRHHNEARPKIPKQDQNTKTPKKKGCLHFHTREG